MCHLTLRLAIPSAALLLLAPACGGDGTDEATGSSPPPAPTSTTGPRPTSPGTTLPAPPTAATLPTTTYPLFEAPAGTMLVVGDDGVYLVEPGGETTLLVDGPVAYAVDDTQGGLLLQVERGSDWYDLLPEGATTVWRIPRGWGAPQTLLVPTPGAGHELSLHDAYASDDGFVVVYTRHEGSTPYEDLADTLRTYHVATGTVTEVYRVRGHEWWIHQVTAAAGTIVATEHQMFGAGCIVVSAGGDSGTMHGIPYSPDCFPSEDVGTNCPTGCALSPGGTRIAYVDPYDPDRPETATIVVADPVTGATSARLTVAADEGWWPLALDVTPGALIVNRATNPEGDGGFLAAYLYDLDAPGAAPRVLAVAGLARFVETPVDIAEPVAAPGRAPAASGDTRFDVSAWVGETYESRPPDYGLVWLDGEDTGLRDWWGSCVGTECDLIAFGVAAGAAETSDRTASVDMMIWLTRSVPAPSGTSQAEGHAMVAARHIVVPSGHGMGYECTHPAATEGWLVVAIVPNEAPTTPTGAWLVSPTSAAITDLDPAGVSCSIVD